MTQADQSEYLSLIASSFFRKTDDAQYGPLNHRLYAKLRREPTWAKFVFISALYPMLLDVSGKLSTLQREMVDVFKSLEVADDTNGYRSFHLAHAVRRKKTARPQRPAANKDVRGRQAGELDDGDVEMASPATLAENISATSTERTPSTGQSSRLSALIYQGRIAKALFSSDARFAQSRARSARATFSGDPRLARRRSAAIVPPADVNRQEGQPQYSPVAALPLDTTQVAQLAAQSPLGYESVNRVVSDPATEEGEIQLTSSSDAIKVMLRDEVDLAFNQYSVNMEAVIKSAVESAVKSAVKSTIESAVKNSVQAANKEIIDVNTTILGTALRLEKRISKIGEDVTDCKDYSANAADTASDIVEHLLYREQLSAEESDN